MDKRYQVFVSSTYVDLKEERQEVIQALLELDCIPAGMELFPAADEDQWSLIKKVIDDCDYYIVIVGGRYGSISPTGLSYTQMEYEYAVSQGKPVIGFIHKSPDEIPSSKSEQTKQGKTKLNTFRRLVQQKTCKYWSTPAELGAVVSRSLVKLIKSKPAIGWVRASLVPDKSSSEEILRLRDAIEELENKLATVSFEKPPNTEDLSQGDDKVILHYSFVAKYTGDFDPKYDTHETTWNELFNLLGPYLLSESAESNLKKVLNRFVESVDNDPVVDTGLEDFSLDSNDFQNIKIQLRALGLITISERTRGSEPCWTLTPYGDMTLTKMRAIKRTQSVTS